jgi:hypothetical protein
MNEKSLDEILAEGVADCAQSQDSSTTDSTTLTLWVPKSYKEKYKAFQKKTGGKCGKTLRTIVMRALDKIEPLAP